MLVGGLTGHVSTRHGVCEQCTNGCGNNGQKKGPALLQTLKNMVPGGSTELAIQTVSSNNIYTM